MEIAQRILRQSPFDSDWAEMLTLMDLGEAYRVAGQNYQASEVFEKVNGLLLSMGRDETQSAGVLFNDWGLALEKLGRPLEAERLFRRAIDVHRAGQTEDAVPPVILNNYAITLRTLARLGEAADYAGRAYEKAQRAGDQFAVYRSLNVRASIYLDQHDFARAEAMLGQLEPILAGTFPPGNMWFGLLASSQALLASGKGDQQRALLLGAIKIGGQGADQLPIVLIRRASIELQAERPSQAAADALRAVNLLQSAAPKGTFSSHTGTAYLELGQSLQAEGKVEEARGAFRSATEHLEKTLGPDDPRSRAARQFAGLKTQ
jgi:tetratricopeptide (TPR) repeat protein